jgi:hypothetical protein
MKFASDNICFATPTCRGKIVFLLVMATFIDTASIFQLAFGVNAVLPAVHLAFRRTHESISRRFADELQKQHSEFKFDEWEMSEFRRFVFGSSRGLKFASRAKIVPILMFLIAIVLSFLGLIKAATAPQDTLNSELVWSFAIYSLIVCPSVGLMYELFLGRLEHLIVLRWFEPANVLDTAKHFKIFLETRKIGVESEQLSREVQSRAAELEIARLKYTWNSYKRKLLRLMTLRK